MSLCNHNCDTVQRNRVRREKILCLLDEERVLKHAVVELVYKFDVSPTVNARKGESIAKVRFQTFFGPQTYTIIYMDTNTDQFTALMLRVRVIISLCLFLVSL